MNCPRARQLKDSELVTAQRNTIDGLMLEFLLYENAQMPLPLPPLRGAQVAIGANDGFAAEVAAVRAESTGAGRRFVHAASPTRTIDEVRDETDFGIRLRELRSRMRTNRPIFVPRTPLHPELADVNTAILQPQGICARVTAKITNLSPARALLRSVETLEPIPNDLIKATYPKSIAMIRPKLSLETQTCVALMAAMDTAATISLDVVVCLDWTSAQPAHLELRGIAGTGATDSDVHDGSCD